MNTVRTKHAVTLEDVEQLLSTRIKTTLTDCHQEIVSLAKVISGFADEKTIRDVDNHLSSCQACRETLTTLYRVEIRPELDELDKAVSSQRTTTPRSRIWKQLSFSAAAMLMGALFIFLLLPKDQLDREPARFDNRFAAKGHGDNLVVAVNRKGKVFTTTHLDTLMADDHLGFFYTATTPGYLAVLNRDARGTVAVIYPSSTSLSAPIPAGEQISLEDGAIVEEGNRCEWIIGVFSENPLPLTALRQAVQRGKESHSRCGLSVQIPAARNILVLPFER